MALTVVRDTGHRFGAAHIVHVLRGSENEKVIKFGHDRLSAYGAGTDRPQREWQGILRQMVAAGLLEIDIAGYGGLRATPAGMALLTGEGAFRYRPDRISKEPKAKRESAAAVAADNLDPADAQLLRSLKTLRLELAKERGVPAYVIFSDRSLVDMAAKRPGTQDDFADVYGVGETKLRDFAPIFLQAIAENAAAE